MPLPITIKRHNVTDRDLQKAVDLFFNHADWKGLYLTGGTCLAEFYFGHRTSIDIDLFTKDRELFVRAGQVLSQPDFFPFGRLEPRRKFPEFQDFLIIRPDRPAIKVDVVLDIPVALGEKISFESIWLDSLEDIVSNKIGCLINRNEVKDYLDLYYLIPEIKKSIGELLELGLQKDAGVDPLVVAHQMTFIQSIKTSPDIFLANVPWQHVLDYFSRLHDEILDTLT